VEADEVDGVVQAAGDVTEQIWQEIGPASLLHGGGISTSYRCCLDLLIPCLLCVHT
jgi:hypothetical protein